MSQAAPFLCDLRDLLFQNLLFEKSSLLSKTRWTSMFEQKIAEVAKGEWRLRSHSRNLL